MNASQNSYEEYNLFYKYIRKDSDLDFSCEGIDKQADIFKQRLSPNSEYKQQKEAEEAVLKQSNNNLKNYRYYHYL